MAIQLQDGTGTGNLVKVNGQNQLRTVAETQEMEHYHAREFSRVFVMPVTYTHDGSGVVLHMKNDSQRRNIVFHQVHMQVVGFTGGTAFPDSGNYLVLEYGPTRSSGGTLLTAANTRRDSGRVSDAVIYSDPTVSGTGEEIDRWYPKEDGDWIRMKREEAHIIGFNDTFQIRLVTDHTSGVVQVNVRYSEINLEIE